MALLQEIWAGKIPDFLRRKFLMRGGLRMQMPGDIQPVVDIDNVEIGDRLSLGEQLYSVGTLVNAVAAAFGRIALLNPAGSGILLENEFITFWTASASAVEFHDGAALAGSNPFLPEDSRSDRWAIVTAHPIALTADTNAAQFPAGAAVQSGSYQGSLARVPLLLPVKFVLHPGHQWGLSETVVNSQIVAHFFGRYRNLLPGES